MLLPSEPRHRATHLLTVLCADNNLLRCKSTQGKHIVNIFKEAKAAYQDRKASIKAERAAAAAADGRPAIRRAQTYDARSRGPESQYYDEYDDHVYDIPERRHFLPIEQQTHYTHERYVEEPEDIADSEGGGDRRRSVDDARSHASSRRSHGTHRSKRSRATLATSTATTRPGGARPPLTASNLRTLTEISATTPSQVPRAYRSAYAETATQQHENNMALGRPALVHAPYTAPPSVMSRTTSAPNLQQSALVEGKKKKKKEIDMNLAYGNIPPDLASRTDLGPVTAAEEHDARVREEARKEQEARTLMARIDNLLLEAECVQHSATSIIDHLQRKPEAAAAVALMLAELSTLLKAMSPSFLGVVKGGFPAIFALLASPQFLIGVGVAVGVTVVFFGGWKIVKRIKEAKAIAAEKSAAAQAFEMQSQAAPSQYQTVPPVMAPSVPPSEYYHQQQQGMYGAAGPGSYDDALVLDEELSSIETWRRGITPSEEGGEEELESVDLELITPEAARSVRGDAQSTRTTRTHRSSKSHRSHRSSHSRRHHDDDGEEEDEERTVVAVPARKSSALAARAESVAPTERSHRTSRSKTTVRTELRAIEDGSRAEENTLDMVLRGKDKKPNMLKTLFKKKKDREDASVSVMA